MAKLEGYLFLSYYCVTFIGNQGFDLSKIFAQLKPTFRFDSIRFEVSIFKPQHRQQPLFKYSQFLATREHEGTGRGAILF